MSLLDRRSFLKPAWTKPRLLVAGLALLAFAATVLAAPALSPTRGPLVIHPTNPRWFADADGRAVFLVGSHNWANFQDRHLEGDKPFDHDA